jgi:hypothetical protein
LVRSLVLDDIADQLKSQPTEFFPFSFVESKYKKRINSNYAEEELEINTIQFFNLTIVIMVIIRHCPDRLLVDLNQRIYSTLPLNRILKKDKIIIGTQII